MIFSTYTYALFLTLVFAVHWATPSRVRPWLLIAASYFFYATWRWPYVALLAAITLFNWTYARFVWRTNGSAPLWPGVLVNVLVLVYFKYSDFLIQNLAVAARAAGIGWKPAALNITLPLGISFFTFQGIAYLIDVATGEEPFHSLRDFMLYKAFWPQLIAGPIVRPSELRAQIESVRRLSHEDISEGLRRILRGAFKKIVLADTLGAQVDLAFNARGSPHALDTIAATIGFGFQIYFDFSAYSDFAIGSARLFGFRLPENFRWPYAAKSPQEFWTRWHITLSRWIRDYVYTPLSFALRDRRGLRGLCLVAAMTLCGLWHGPAWTFVLWGAWHGLLLLLQQTALKRLFVSGARVMVLLGWLLTLLGVFAGWLLFRAPTLSSVAEHLRAVATFSGGWRPALIRENGVLAIGVIAAGTLLVSVAGPALEEAWLTLERSSRIRNWARPAFYAALLGLIIVLDQEAKAFVYFQF